MQHRERKLCNWCAGWYYGRTGQIYCAARCRKAAYRSTARYRRKHRVRMRDHRRRMRQAEAAAAATASASRAIPGWLL